MNDNELQKRVDQLERDLRALNDEYYQNNFSNSQDFNKFSRFNTRLKVPHYDTLPSVCEVGEICESGGKLKVCSAANTWTTVGTQT